MRVATRRRKTKLEAHVNGFKGYTQGWTLALLPSCFASYSVEVWAVPFSAVCNKSVQEAQALPPP